MIKLIIKMCLFFLFFFALKALKTAWACLSQRVEGNFTETMCSWRPSGHVSILLIINTASVLLFQHQRSFRLSLALPRSLCLSHTAHRHARRHMHKPRGIHCTNLHTDARINKNVHMPTNAYAVR